MGGKPLYTAFPALLVKVKDIFETNSRAHGTPARDHY
jgi:hypothetical protein